VRISVAARASLMSAAADDTPQHGHRGDASIDEDTPSSNTLAPTVPTTMSAPHPHNTDLDATSPTTTTTSDDISNSNGRFVASPSLALMANQLNASLHANLSHDGTLALMQSPPKSPTTEASVSPKSSNGINVEVVPTSPVVVTIATITDATTSTKAPLWGRQDTSAEELSIDDSSMGGHHKSGKGGRRATMLVTQIFTVRQTLWLYTHLFIPPVFLAFMWFLIPLKVPYHSYVYGSLLYFYFWAMLLSCFVSTHTIAHSSSLLFCFH
jgi:hypothetical protein